MVNKRRTWLNTCSILLVAALAVAAMSCRSAGVSMDGWQCKAPADTLPAGATAVGLEGKYEVFFVGTSGEARGKRLITTLTLTPHDSSRQRFRYTEGLREGFNPNLLMPSCQGPLL